MEMLEVTRVELAEGECSAESITFLSGNRWRKPASVIIAEIEKGKHAYYVFSESKNILVAVALGLRGRYLRTRTAGRWSDLLLSLADCRAASKPA